MDYRCKYDTKEDAASGNRITILYGHNMYSGLMFANVNKLLDSLAFAQSAPVIQFSSLFGENNYKVFAIVSNDTSEQGGETFLRTEFSDDKDFLEYVAELRLRSWYNYNDVDVRADDQLLMLYTCSNTYQTTMGKEGRTILVARKVRTGESAEVDISSITENDNKLMPRQWYANNGLELPAYYTSKDAAQAALREILGDDYYADDNDVTVSSVKKNPVASKKPKQTPVEEDEDDYYEDDEYYYEDDYDDEEYYYEDEEEAYVEPVEEEPVATDPPVEEPVEEEPVEEEPVEEEPVEEAPAEEPAE
ncbi:MAG: class B sortase [Clostridia bacterium]|nr:class B sortase [Clostridia bacterium]